MAEITEQEKRCEVIKNRLKEYCLPYKWLQCELIKRGMRVSTQEISDVITGHRKGKFAEGVAKMSILVLDIYFEKYLN